jgi:hypothetical protein
MGIEALLRQHPIRFEHFPNRHQCSLNTVKRVPTETLRLFPWTLEINLAFGAHSLEAAGLPYDYSN